MNQAELSIESRHAEQAKISANWIARLREVMAGDEQARILDDTLRAADISEHHIVAGKNVRQDQVNRVVQYVLPKVPDITLRMFARAELADLGALGYAALNSDTVGHAVSFLNRYHALTSDRYTEIIEIEGDTAVVAPIPVMSHIFEFSNVAEDSLMGNWRALHLLLGASVDYKLGSVHFAFSAPSYVDAFYEVFDCPVYFNADRSELRFPAKWLNRPIATADKAQADVCRAMCEPAPFSRAYRSYFGEAPEIHRRSIRHRGDASGANP